MSIQLVSSFVPSPSTIRGQTTHLYADQKSNRIVFPSGKNIIIRDLDNPSSTIVYSGHSQQTTVASFSPSGYYVASGDIAGNVRIWDTVGEEHILKSTFRPLSGPIRDLQWDSDNQRILAVGEGKEKFGQIFTFDSGNSVGTIDGHSKTINGCSIRQKRPFRAATCSDDFTVVFFQGAPYKFVKSIRDHTSFVNDVKFSPDGAYFIFLYDGVSGDLICQLSDKDSCHKGTIYAVSWSPESDHFMTSSADKTFFYFYLKQHIKYFHNILLYSSSQGPTVVTGKNLKSQVNCLSFNGAGNLLIGTNDDSISVVDVLKSEIIKAIKLGGAPRNMALLKPSNSTIACLSNHTVVLVLETGLIVNFELKGEPTYVAAHPSLSEIAVGYDDNSVKIFEIQGLPLSSNIKGTGNSTDVSIKSTGITLTEKCIVSSHIRSITCLSYSPDGKFLASGDQSGKIYISNSSTGETTIKNFVSHSAMIKALSWFPDSIKLVSGSLDSNVIVWNISKTLDSKVMKLAHPGGVVAVAVVSESEFVSCGSDSVIKKYILA
ncbi:Actin-interacting protein 1 [Smittium mucronatum]|uniref:Actin-interacting protein 1 n=1 Tax=Smittium mucronatum TaxID=133383 RepID=A0A1R0H4T8_9FUNG|nr:Actin-interacting protein 1 [Smittium mucronatum]